MAWAWHALDGGERRDPDLHRPARNPLLEQAKAVSDGGTKRGPQRLGSGR